jgi:putative FmdB family regulatory protein
MPTYDYRCNACGHTFEHFQSMKDAVLRTCPACKKKSLERLIGTGAALIFKGAGFYQTDYRSESYKAAEKAEAPAGADGDAVSTGKQTEHPSASSGGNDGTASGAGKASGKKDAPAESPTAKNAGTLAKQPTSGEKGGGKANAEKQTKPARRK